MGACTEATLAPHAATAAHRRPLTCYEFQCLFTRTDGSRLLGCEPILTQSAVGSSSSAPCGSSAHVATRRSAAAPASRLAPDAAAVRIQATYRGFETRRCLADGRTHLDRQATLVQSRFRWPKRGRFHVQRKRLCG